MKLVWAALAVLALLSVCACAGGATFDVKGSVCDKDRPELCK